VFVLQLCSETVQTVFCVMKLLKGGHELRLSGHALLLMGSGLFLKKKLSQAPDDFAHGRRGFFYMTGGTSPY
jgi:hypothetical protein